MGHPHNSMRDVRSHPVRRVVKPRTPIKPRVVAAHPDTWTGIDMAFQNLRHVSPSVFHFSSIRELRLENNKLSELPSNIDEMKNLEVLNLSNNQIFCLPVQLCKCKLLRELDLSNNLLTSIPLELGGLCNIEQLNLDGNPLIEPFFSIYKVRGGVGLLNFCRENNTAYPMPLERLWLRQMAGSFNGGVKVGTYNILSEKWAIPRNFPCLPECILQSEYRMESLIQEISQYRIDILCCQEMETLQYNGFFSAQLESKCGYASVFFPKPRQRQTLLGNKGMMDGCAIFWKKSMFHLLDQRDVDLQKIISEDPRFNKSQSTMIRNAEKNNVATIILLEKESSDQFIIANVHICWDPECDDIKLLQTLVLIEEIERFRARHPKASIILCGDFNSLRNSLVINFITDGIVKMADNGSIIDGLIKDQIISHNLKFYDAHKDISVPFTHMAYGFSGVVDYIFHSPELLVLRILAPNNEDYFDRIPCLPSVHLSSDHLLVASEFIQKEAVNGH